jgi:glycerate dehydrogenase
VNIVVLDGYALNPGDVSWDSVRELGELTVYDRTPAELIVERAARAEIVLTNKTPLRADVLAKLPRTKFIGVLATGYDVVDVAAAGSQGIPVANVPGYSTASVAQTVFSLLLELCQHVGAHSDAVHAGVWSKSSDFSFHLSPLTELAGKTLGLVGYGQIGEQVGRIGSAFGMRIAAYRRTPQEGRPYENFAWTDLPTLYRESDVISFHCPLTPETEGMVNKDSLAMMKRTALLINTARGKLIVERDLASALENGTIAGAALDVLSAEPPPADHPLFGVERCLITPHLAWATKEARERLIATTVGNIRGFLDGRPANVVNDVNVANAVNGQALRGKEG